MRTRVRGALVLVTLLAPVWLVFEPVAAQAPAGQSAAYNGPRTLDGRPDLNGIWQVLGTAAWDLEAHSAEEGVPAGQSVVEGGDIPYQPWAAAKKKENYAQRKTVDPLSNCYLPGLPRVMYIPMPFEITQSPKYVAMSFEFAHARRIIYTDGSPHVEALEFWMGDSRGRWEGNTLVVDSIDFNDRTWFDHAGNFHSDALHVVERFTPIDPNHVTYEVTIDDPKVFTQPWKMSMVMYRRLEKGLQLLDYDCVSQFWQKVVPGWQKYQPGSN